MFEPVIWLAYRMGPIVCRRRPRGAGDGSLRFGTASRSGRKGLPAGCGPGLMSAQIPSGSPVGDDSINGSLLAEVGSGHVEG
jgi:hypothetical protein